MKKMGKIKIILAFMVIFLLIFGQSAFADMGPKPSLDIKIINLPDGEYYVDLLILDADSDYGNNLDGTHEYNPDMIKILEQYDEDGYSAAMAVGTSIPIFGDIICEVKDGVGNISFRYMGVPEHFKLIIVSKDLDVIVSPDITTFAFQANVTYDSEKNSLKESNITISYGWQFAQTFFGTILLELLILFAFKFSIKANWKAFLIINFITQMLLTSAIIYFTMMSDVVTAFIVFLILEPVVFLIEAVLFTRLLKEHKRSRRFFYAVVANLFSFGIGILITLSSAF